MDSEFEFYYKTFSKWQVSKLIKHKKMHLINIIGSREDDEYEEGFPILRTSKKVVDVVDYVLKEKREKNNA
tara:strand:+ start:2795 stop:3007 length:213 start_codon:yes stop_codon:yes gene_type:complete